MPVRREPKRGLSKKPIKGSLLSNRVFVSGQVSLAGRRCEAKEVGGEAQLPSGLGPYTQIAYTIHIHFISRWRP